MLFVDKEQVKVTKFPNGELLVDTTLLRKLKDSKNTYLPILLYKYDVSDSIQELMLACDYLLTTIYIFLTYHTSVWIGYRRIIVTRCKHS